MLISSFLKQAYSTGSSVFSFSSLFVFGISHMTVDVSLCEPVSQPVTLSIVCPISVCLVLLSKPMCQNESAFFFSSPQTAGWGSFKSINPLVRVEEKLIDCIYIFERFKCYYAALLYSIQFDPLLATKKHWKAEKMSLMLAVKQRLHFCPPRGIRLCCSSFTEQREASQEQPKATVFFNKRKRI